MKDHPKGFASLADFPELQPYTEPVKVLDQGFVRLVSLMGSDGDIVTTARVTTGKGRSKHEGLGEVIWKDNHGGERTAYRNCTVCKQPIYGEVKTVSGALDSPRIPGSWRVGDVSFAFFPTSPDAGVCVEGDRRMLRFMFKHHHLSPFEFAEAVFHLRIPMDAWRQMVRHRTASISEYSTRYSPAVDAMMETDPTEWRLQSGSNRQGSDGFVTKYPEDYHPDQFREPPGEYLTERETELHDLAKDVYEERLAFGVAKEQARKDLPLSNYTDVFWKCDLRNLLHFLSLRMDEHAQKEIRDYANVIGEIVKVWCPIIWEAFEDYEFHAKTLSRMDLNVVRELMQAACETWGERSNFEDLFNKEARRAGLSSRETTDLLNTLLPESS